MILEISRIPRRRTTLYGTPKRASTTTS
jgi:hypothetical protein